MFACICVEDHDDTYDMKSLSELRTSHPSQQTNIYQDRNNPRKTSRRHVDRVVIYTGAVGSPEYVDDDHDKCGHECDDDRFSEVYSALESEVSNEAFVDQGM